VEALKAVPARTRRTSPPCFAVVRRGDVEVYRFLQERYTERNVVDVRWDRREGDRRTSPEGSAPDRRRRDRRRPMPATWRTQGFVVVPFPATSGMTAPGAAEPDTARAVLAPPPVAPEGAQRLGLPVRLVARPAAADDDPAPPPPVATRPGDPQRLAGIVLLTRREGVVTPSFFDAAAGAWRCGSCEGVLVARHVGRDTPRRGDLCPLCQAEVVRVLRWRWQRVNWVALALLAFFGLLAVQVVWPLLARVL